MNPPTYAKALIGALLAGLGALGTALTDGAVSWEEAVIVAIATLTTLGGVYEVRNGVEADPTTSTPEI